MSLNGTVTFDDALTSTFHNFDISFSSPLTPLVPGNPFSHLPSQNGGDYGNSLVEYADTSTEDYPTVFQEQFAALVSENGFNFSTGEYSAFDLALRVDSNLPPRNGDGSSNFQFTPANVDSYLNGFIQSGAPVVFEEDYQTYRIVDGKVIYDSGMAWTTSAAILTGLSPAAVPEPSTWAMFIVGFGGIGTLLRISRRMIAA